MKCQTATTTIWVDENTRWGGVGVGVEMVGMGGTGNMVECEILWE